ncbi:NYN domain-containing protein [Desulfosporosinus fructosivorans]|uniref:NYN domain-containing protein n=1 Tax=Desulfosporosinus fructosivorans TaxID=2018669 RepID=A0A4Z0R7G1_9FIRM|nr:NYN domain-containing protein [Desulfosporosinus fructosivorans]TGE38325.1 NYN domain-containing protein [Desulfosporosinus fructosivorans]
MKAIAFVDYENIWTGLLERGYDLTPEQLVQFLQIYTKRNDIDLLAIYLYANFDREEFWRTQTTFEKTNVFTRHVFGKNNYASTGLRRNAADLELMLEAQEILLTRASTFDMFVLLTGDGDFLSLLRKVRAWGKEVRVIGVAGSIHHALHPYCEGEDLLQWVIHEKPETEYYPEQDLEQGIQILGTLQTRLPYVASTKARAALTELLGRSISQVKEFIRYTLKESILIEREHPDPNLKIGKTKIYLLNLENSIVLEALGSMREEVFQRQKLITEPNHA